MAVQNEIKINENKKLIKMHWNKIKISSDGAVEDAVHNSNPGDCWK